MKKILIAVVIISISAVFLYVTIQKPKKSPEAPVTMPITTTPTPEVHIPKIPDKKIIINNYHIYQTFNNCGPAAFSMALSYYGIDVTQKELGDSLRPYQITDGNNDDKSVTLAELATKAREYGLTPYHRPNGSIEIIKQIIGLDMPVITRTTLSRGEDIGHFRIVKGYDTVSGTIVQDDSMQGKDLVFSANEFSELWKVFNYEFLILAAPEKKNLVEKILGENADEKKSWEIAAKNAEKQYLENNDDIYAHFNRSVALYHIGKFTESVQEFESVENRLPKRHLWYQIEPILAYYELGNYNRIFFLSDKIINNGNRAYAELYVIRGKSYLKQGNREAAGQELKKAIYYNKNLEEAASLIKSL